MVGFCGNWQLRRSRVSGRRIEVFLRGEVCLIFLGGIWDNALEVSDMRIVWKSFLAGAFVVTAGADVAKAGFTPEHAAKMKHVQEASLSPDGRHIAYVLLAPRDSVKGKNGVARRELHVVDWQGESRPFVTGNISASSLAWSPDGRTITYLAKRGEDKHISLYGIPLDGGESQKIFGHEADISKYHWSGRADRFLFVATEKVEENKAKEKGFNAEVYEEETKRGRVWIARREGTDDWEAEALAMEGSVFDARWSPNDRRLAVAVAPKPFIDFFYMYQKIKIVDAGSGAVLAEVDHRGKLGAFRWNSNGSSLAFLGGAHIHDPSPGRLFVADTSNGSSRRLAADYLPDFAAAEWLNEETLLFIADNGCETDYGRLNAVSGERQLLNFQEAPVAAGMSCVPQAKRAAFVASTPSHGFEAFAARTDGRRMRRLTRSNSWLDDVPLARQEVVRYTARDGVEVEGVLLYPLSYQKGERYPLILVVHGGPEARVANSWVTTYSRPGQFAASNDYLVFYPNYRGSTGRGLEYAMSHQADYAGKEFDDLVDAIDYLDKIGLADPKKVGVTGGSYGGYASAWCATYYTKRFAASVMFVGVSDLISKHGTTDIPDEMYLVHARKRPWEDWSFFLERSPIYYAEQARTPILILHGKDDPRVHPSQSLELYRTLKTLGKTPTRLVWYPGEGHGNRRAAARYDYSLRLMRWMNHYLKGQGGAPPPHMLNYGLDEENGEETKKSGPLSARP